MATRPRVVVGAVVSSVCLVLLAACTPAPVVEVPAGEPGAPGPCGTATTDLVNRVDWRHALTVAEPTGDQPAPDGGNCSDDERPVVLIAHGYLGNFVAGYEGLVRHLVSQGYVVVFPGYTAEFNVDHQYKVVGDGFVQATQWSDRMDLSKVGGHRPFVRRGMLPWLVQGSTTVVGAPTRSGRWISPPGTR
ncbi:MAG: hypothetical protein M5U19_15110 [Microthrixaceae bacterium]|nr:hypothetical protein [Microthrixaceae bacterium]